MTFLEKIGLAVEEFVTSYGVSFLVMAFGGFLIAFITELGVKKSFKWLETQLGEKTWLKVAKVSVIFVVTNGLVAASTAIAIRGDLPLPGSKALAPFWYGFIYICQYVFSMYGIKNILKIKEREKEPKAPKEPKPKKEKVDPVAGFQKISKNLYTDGQGNYFDRKGRPYK